MSNCRWTENSSMIPAILWPSWRKDTVPLLKYLVHSRTIDDILFWATERGIKHALAKNQLAWLSISGSAHFNAALGRWMQESDRESAWGTSDSPRAIGGE